MRLIQFAPETAREQRALGNFRQIGIEPLAMDHIRPFPLPTPSWPVPRLGSRSNGLTASGGRPVPLPYIPLFLERHIAVTQQQLDCTETAA